MAYFGLRDHLGGSWGGERKRFCTQLPKTRQFGNNRKFGRFREYVWWTLRCQIVRGDKFYNVIHFVLGFVTSNPNH